MGSTVQKYWTVCFVIHPFISGAPNACSLVKQQSDPNRRGPGPAPALVTTPKSPPDLTLLSVAAATLFKFHGSKTACALPMTNLSHRSAPPREKRASAHVGTRDSVYATWSHSSHGHNSDLAWSPSPMGSPPGPTREVRNVAKVDLSHCQAQRTECRGVATAVPVKKGCLRIILSEP